MSRVGCPRMPNVVQALCKNCPRTGKSFSKALILASVNHNMTRDCSLNYKKNTSSGHVLYKYCFECWNKNKQKHFCTQHVMNLYFSCNSMNNFSSYCGLTDARMKGVPK